MAKQHGKRKIARQDSVGLFEQKESPASEPAPAPSAPAECGEKAEIDALFGDGEPAAPAPAADFPAPDGGADTAQGGKDDGLENDSADVSASSEGANDGETKPTADDSWTGADEAETSAPSSSLGSNGDVYIQT